MGKIDSPVFEWMKALEFALHLSRASDCIQHCSIDESLDISNYTSETSKSEFEVISESSEVQQSTPQAILEVKSKKREETKQKKKNHPFFFSSFFSSSLFCSFKKNLMVLKKKMIYLFIDGEIC